MKTLNLTGTTSETFKIGIGNNIVELRVIQGKLYFRNFGDTFKELLSNDAELVLSPLNWSPQKNYGAGDLVYYNNILFSIITSHKSSNNFLSNTDNYRKIAHVNAELTKINVTSYLNNFYVINVLSSNFIYLFGTGSDNFTVRLPDSNSIALSSKYIIQNNSSKIIEVVNNSNQLIAKISPLDTKEFILIDKNIDDFWTAFSLIPSTVDFGNLDEKRIVFNPNQQIKIFGPSGVFENQPPGKYSFFALNDVQINGEFYWNLEGYFSPNEVTGTQQMINLYSFGTKIISGITNDKFCYFLDGNKELYFSNKTNESKDIIFQFTYKKGIR